MERETVFRWLEEHPETVQGDAGDLVTRCERSVRRHAREDAWLAAKQYLEGCESDWEHNVGAHASETYVARDVCRKLAAELQRHEPAPHEGDEEHLAGGPVRAAVDAEGWTFLMRWILDLAREQEHQTWTEIVSFTQGRARDLIRSHHLSDDCSFDRSRCYGEVALHIARLLEHDYSARAFPR